MVISGNTLPALTDYSASLSGQNPPDQRNSNRFSTADQQNRQQASAYIFRGEFDSDGLTDDHLRDFSHQQIHPANLKAITQYIDIEIESLRRSERQGHLLDIFV